VADFRRLLRTVDCQRKLAHQCRVRGRNVRQLEMPELAVLRGKKEQVDIAQAARLHADARQATLAIDL